MALRDEDSMWLLIKQALSAKASEETGCFTFFRKENELSDSISESFGTGDVWTVEGNVSANFKYSLNYLINSS